MKSQNIGDIVKIVFLDHVEDSDEPIKFEVFGRIIKTGKTSTTIGSWLYTEETNDPGEANIKTWCIVNSTIQQITTLTNANN